MPLPSPEEELGRDYRAFLRRHTGDDEMSEHHPDVAYMSCALLRVAQAALQAEVASQVGITIPQMEKRDFIQKLLDSAPYPFCRTPLKCGRKGYCTREIACDD